MWYGKRIFSVIHISLRQNATNWNTNNGGGKQHPQQQLKKKNLTYAFRNAFVIIMKKLRNVKLLRKTSSKQQTFRGFFFFFRPSYASYVRRDTLRMLLCHSLSVITRLIRVARKVKYEPNIISSHITIAMVVLVMVSVCTWTIFLYLIVRNGDTFSFEKFNSKNFYYILKSLNWRNEPNRSRREKK